MPTTTALVTGATGFVGPYAIEALAADGSTVWGLSPGGEDVGPARGVAADLRDAALVREVLATVRPALILHLAAQSSVPASFDAPTETLSNNLLGAAHLLYAAAALDPPPRVLVVGSAEEYGRVPADHLPIGELQPLAPLSPYGVSKAAQSLLALSLFAGHGLPTVVLRPFNHTGPGQGTRFSVPSFARRIARIEVGLEEPVMRVGNLEARRDFTDVRDIARAYALAAHRATPGEAYNLGSGASFAMRDVLGRLLALSPAARDIEVRATGSRPGDILELRADASKFRSATGWAPRIGLDETLADVLADWRERTRTESEGERDKGKG